MNLSRKQRLLLSVLSGVLLSLGWPARGFPFLLLIGFIPLLLVEYFFYKDIKKRKAFVFFCHAYLAMLVWNALTTWWVCNSTIVGGVLAILFNSLFMALVLMLFHIVKRRIGAIPGYVALTVFWMAFEYLHLNWQLSWPWLTLGFGFSNYTSCIQWYEFTGPFGGTLWILLSNVILFTMLPKKRFVVPIAVFLVPILISFALYHFWIPCDKCPDIHVVIVQPNIDPYNEKFTGDTKTQVNKMLTLAEMGIDAKTNYLFFPETALTEEIWENNLHDNASIPLLIDYCKHHPGLSIITGAATSRQYYPGDYIPESARKVDDKGDYVDYYNTALQIDSSGKVDVYHKSKLVPGVEFMPFNKFLKPLADLAFKLGGESGTLGTQKEPTVFLHTNSLGNTLMSVTTTIAPVICYESIYGEYVSEYVKKGAGIIAIITNDGWWEDTPGYRQHLCYGRMLGIETRKYIIQCANTGTSAIIDERGNVLQSTGWWRPATLKAEIPYITGSTFYVLHGDYLGLWACWVSLLLMVFYLYKLFSDRYSKPL